MKTTDLRTEIRNILNKRFSKKNKEILYKLLKEYTKNQTITIEHLFYILLQDDFTTDADFLINLTYYRSKINRNTKQKIYRFLRDFGLLTKRINKQYTEYLKFDTRTGAHYNTKRNLTLREIIF